MAERLIRLYEVMSRTGLSRTSVYECIAAGTFPKQIPLETRSDGRASTVGWIASEVDVWIKAKIAESRERPAPTGARIRENLPPRL